MVFIRLVILLLLLPFCASAQQAKPETKKISIITLGDQLMSGVGVSAYRDFSGTLERELLARQYEKVRVFNKSTDDETTTSALERIDEIIEEKPYIVIVSLGLNDVKQKVPLQTIYSNLYKIISNLHENRIRVLLVGFHAPAESGDEYGEKFIGMYRYLSQKHRLALCDNFLDGFSDDPQLINPDNIHPNQNGVEKLVANILPVVEKIIKKAQGKG